MVNGKILNTLKENEKGLSLLELVAVIIILSLILGISYGVILLNAKTFKVLSDNIVVRWDVRKAMKILRRDLQALDGKNIYGPILNSKKGSSLYFTDIDGNHIMYRFSNKKLLRKKGSGGWDIILDNTAGVEFYLLDRELKPTSNLNKLSYIKVIFTIPNGDNPAVNLEDIFYLRNTPRLKPN